MTGKMAAEILGGVDPATIPIPDKIPQKLVVNKQALKGLKDPGCFEEVRAKADVLIDEDGVHGTSQVAIRKPPEGRLFKIGVVYFGPDPSADACMAGLFGELKNLGFVEGKNLQVRKAHAQGEIINIPSILQNFDNEDLDLIIPMSTPVLTAAINAVKKARGLHLRLRPDRRGRGKDSDGSSGRTLPGRAPFHRWMIPWLLSENCCLKCKPSARSTTAPRPIPEKSSRSAASCFKSTASNSKKLRSPTRAKYSRQRRY